MLRTVNLYGNLAQKFGAQHRFDISYVRQAVSALSANFKGFREDFAKGYYRIIIGDLNKGVSLGEKEINLNVGSKDRDLHIIPVPIGAKSQGQAAAFKIVAGLALLVPFGFAAAGALAAGASAGAAATAAASTSLLGGLATAGGLAKVGVALALAGTASLLAPTPSVGDYGNRERPDERPSFLFNGPTNTSTQGLPVPIVYGTFRVGSVQISTGMQAEGTT